MTWLNILEDLYFYNGFLVEFYIYIYTRNINMMLTFFLGK